MCVSDWWIFFVRSQFHFYPGCPYLWWNPLFVNVLFWTFFCCRNLLKVLFKCLLEVLNLRLLGYRTLCTETRLEMWVAILSEFVSLQWKNTDIKCSLSPSYEELSVGGKEGERKTVIRNNKIHSPADTWNFSCAWMLRSAIQYFFYVRDFHFCHFVFCS